MTSDLEMETGKSLRLASGQREIGRKVKGKKYVISAPGQREKHLIRQGKVEGFLQSWGTQRHARTK